MKTILAFIFFFTVYSAANAQSVENPDPEGSYAIIHDPDGFVNVRKEKSIKSTVKGKIYKDDIFTCFPDKSDWWKVVRIEDNRSWLEGYVHKSRITLLLHWKEINKKNIYKDSSTFRNDSLVVIVKKAAFDAKKHQLTGKSGDIISIDNKPFWGTDGATPKQIITSVKVFINGKSILIPTNAFDDLYEPNLENLSVGFGPENTIYISMLNSDGAGGYNIIWIIKNNRFYKRYVDNIDA